MAIKSSKNTILLINQTLSELNLNINYLLEESFKYTKQNLFIYCLNPPNNNNNTDLNNDLSGVNHIDRFQLKSIIKQFYNYSFKLNPKINVSYLLPSRLVPIRSYIERYGYFNYDLILTTDNISSRDESKIEQIIEESLPHFKCALASPTFHQIDCSLNNTNVTTKLEDVDVVANENDLILKGKMYKNSIIGGTFDRLHIGHKIMLTESALLTRNKLLVGVSDNQLLASKKLVELVEDLDVRAEMVRRFLFAIAPHLQVETVPLTDKFGPSITEVDYQCLIVSQETAKGGEMVNQERVKNKLAELDVHVVSLVKDNSIDLVSNQIDEDEYKVSSSNERKHLLGTLLRPPYIPFDSNQPYVIGLTGGLASGKSSIRKDLEYLGAATIDCDKMGHKAYEKSTRCYHKLVDVFGRDILDADENIDRKELGKRVFGKHDELAKLQEIVWPEIRDLTKQEIDRLFNLERKRVIVVEAAVLFEANWQVMMNEVWVCFIPDQEAIKRSIERDKSSEERVKNILKSQISNQERIKKANVVFCSLWKREYTIKQVKKAWTLLNERLK